jgi:hypothetical protein
VGPSLWCSGETELGYGWNYIELNPPISVCGCSVEPGEPPSAPRILIAATNLSEYACFYPEWGCDNISTQVLNGCEMHEFGCLGALYPRPYNSYYSTMHSGFYGQNFEYCPPEWFRDQGDTTPDATEYGYVELAWRIYLVCNGPTAAKSATWGGIKAMYR